MDTYAGDVSSALDRQLGDDGNEVALLDIECVRTPGRKIVNYDSVEESGTRKIACHERL